MATKAQLYRQAFAEHDQLVQRVKRAENALTDYQNEVWNSLGNYMTKLGSGLSGHQPEAWTVLDAAVNDYCDMRVAFEKLRADFAMVQAQVGKPIRRRLPDTRESMVHKFSVSSHEGYLTVGLFPEDRTPGEMFVVMAKEGSTVGGLMDTIGRLTSVALQSGVTLEVLCDKFIGSRFEPSGYTTNGDIKIASSIIDYVFRWLKMQFCQVPVAAS